MQNGKTNKQKTKKPLQQQFEETARIRTRLRYGGMLELSDHEFKIAIINMLCTVTEKVDNMQEQMGI